MLETQLITAFAVIVTVIGMIIVAYVAKRYGANEKLHQALKMIELVGTQATDWIMTVRFGNVDLRDYNGVNYYDKAAASLETLGRYFDARMLFVVDRVEESVFRATGRKMEFDDIWPTAEKAYQLLNRSDNGLDMNPEATARKAKQEAEAVKRAEIIARPDVVSQSTAALPSKRNRRFVDEFEDGPSSDTKLD